MRPVMYRALVLERNGHATDLGRDARAAEGIRDHVVAEP